LHRHQHRSTLVPYTTLFRSAETLGTMTTAGIPASGSRGAEMNRTDKPELDDAALAFAEQVFDSARNGDAERLGDLLARGLPANIDRKSTRLNSSHVKISYAV